MSTASGPAATTPILHHYDFSPFSEKIRLVFGLKGLRWLSAIAPPVMPKPDLVALTGGYRHIPVLQIGADVFCDTRTIMRELERRHPTPPLTDPKTRGVTRAIEAWAERDLFWPIARYVSGTNAETVDPQLHVDRASLRGKPTPSVARLKEVARRNLAQLRTELPAIEQMLSHGGPWLLSEGPGTADLAAYHGLWFLSAMPIDCSAELAGYPLTRAWMARIAAIGHGSHQALSPAEALAIAASSAPEPVQPSIEDDSLPPPGARVAIRPEDYTTAAVEGRLVQVGWEDIAILRITPSLGEVVVHFPRISYAIKEL